MERNLLSAVYSSREAYDSMKDYVDGTDFSEQGKILYDKAKAFYDRDAEAKTVSTDIILSQIEREMPKYFEGFKRVVQGLGEVSVPNVMDEVLSFKKHMTAMQLSTALAESNHRKVKELIELYNMYDAGVLREDDAEQRVFVGQSVADIAKSFDQANLIRVYPLSFNAHLDGGVPRQTHIIIYAQPEMGKSMFSINMACGMCRDGHKVLYIGNEDPAPNMLMRFVSRFAGLNRMEIRANPDLAQSKAEENGYENLVFVSLPSGTVGEIEQYIKTYKPTAVVVDQIRHLKFRGVDGEVEQLTRAGKELRRLGKKYNVIIISVTQAADSAKNKLVLDQGDVYMSNTSIPGDADILLGIGGNEKFLAENRRMLSPAKNKINNNHAPLAVAVEPLHSKVMSI